MQLLASFHVATRGMRDAVFHVRMRHRTVHPDRIECSCGCVLVYSSTDHDVDNLRVLNQVCSHIIALYLGDFTRGGTVTEYGREMFTWAWAQRALERST